MKIQLGVQAKDKITGFKGTVTGRCEYLSGCHQVLIVPKVGKDGRAAEGAWFDEQRVEALGGKPIVLDNAATPGPDKPAPIR